MHGFLFMSATNSPQRHALQFTFVVSNLVRLHCTLQMLHVLLIACWLFVLSCNVTGSSYYNCRGWNPLLRCIHMITWLCNANKNVTKQFSVCIVKHWGPYSHQITCWAHAVSYSCSNKFKSFIRNRNEKSLPTPTAFACRFAGDWWRSSVTSLLHWPST